MTLFIAIAVGLVVLALVAVVAPLLRKPLDTGPDHARRLGVMAAGLRELDGELAAHTIGDVEYREARSELERQALEAAATGQVPPQRPHRAAALIAAIAVAVVVPAAAAALYLGLGQPALISGGDVQASADANHPGLADMIQHLRDHLAKNPGDAQGWLLLARTYVATGRPEDAASAFARAAELRPKDAELLAEYADTLALVNGRDFSGRPQELIQQALAVDPNNLDALALAGAAALQVGKRDDAVRYWTHLKQLLPAGSSDHAQAEALLAKAQGRAPAAAAGTSISGTVALAPDVASKVRPTDSVFVYAVAENGARMPLAVIRTSASGKWPIAFILDDSKAMMPDQRLSQFPQVDLVTRVSRSSSAGAQPGDLEGRIKGVKLGSRDVKVVVDHVLDR